MVLVLVILGEAQFYQKYKMEIRPYAESDIGKILELFQLVFKKEMPFAYWKWRFLNNPVAQPMIWLMWENDVLIGHYAVSPLQLRIDNNVNLAALSMTTMTHPSYEGRGIFTKLANKLYEEEFNQSNLEIVYGFPNRYSHRGFINQLHWEDIAEIPTLSLLTKDFRFGKIKTSYIIEEVSYFSTHHSETYTTILENYDIKVERSATYLNWRYFDNPISKYRVFELSHQGMSYYIVAKEFKSFEFPNETEIDLIEVIIPNDFMVLTAFMTKILSVYPTTIRINLWMPLKDKKHIEFEKMGFTNKEPITYLGYKINSSTLSLANKNWFYQMGDSDVY